MRGRTSPCEELVEVVLFTVLFTTLFPSKGRLTGTSVTGLRVGEGVGVIPEGENAFEFKVAAVAARAAAVSPRLPTLLTPAELPTLLTPAELPIVFEVEVEVVAEVKLLLLLLLIGVAWGRVTVLLCAKRIDGERTKEETAAAKRMSVFILLQ